MSVADLSRQAGGAVLPGDKNNADDWPAEVKFASVLHEAILIEIELSEYCRSKSLYPEQTSAWHQAVRCPPKCSSR